VTQADFGLHNGCAVVDGAVKCWGLPHYSLIETLNNGLFQSFNQLTTEISSDARKVAIGDKHACAVVRDQLWCWGRNLTGSQNRLFGIDTIDETATPVKVINSGVEDVAIGRSTTCAVVDGDVKCWGESPYEIAGKSSFQNTPKTILSGGSKRVVVDKFAALNACAIRKGGLQCWGLNYSMSRIPDWGLPITYAKSGVTKVSVWGGRGCAIVNDKLNCWGTIIPGTQSNRFFGPFLDGNITDVTHSSNSMCFKSDDIIKCLGSNQYGELGQGYKSNEIITTPLPVILP
jgi:hypothetical protein